MHMVIQQNTAHKLNIGPNDEGVLGACSFMGLLTALAVAKYGEPGGANKRGSAISPGSWN